MVADFADALEIPRCGRHGTGGGTDNRFGGKGHNGFRSDAQQLLLQQICRPQPVGLGRLAVVPQAVVIAGIDVAHIDQQRPELRASPLVAARRKRPHRIAVIALLAGDDAAARRLALLHEILPREFQRRLHRLRSARHQIDPVEIARRMLDQQIGQRFGRLRGEKAGMRIGQLVKLRLDGLDHRPVAVPKTGNSRPARGIKILLAARIREVTAHPRDGDRRQVSGMAGKDMGHRFLHLRAGGRVPGFTCGPRSARDQVLTTSTETGERRTTRSAFEPTRNSRIRFGPCEAMTTRSHPVSSMVSRILSWMRPKARC